MNRTKKHIWICLMVATACLMAADTFAAASKMKISLSATGRAKREKPVKIDDEVETANSLTVTTGETETEVCTVTVKLKSSEEAPVTGQLEWCFISDHSSGKIVDYSPVKPERAMYGPGKKSITLPPGEIVEEIIVSAPFIYEEKTVETESYTGNGNTTSRDYETGDVYKGFLILLTVDGEIVATKASTSSYAKEEWVDLLRGASK
jgi:hypothetical protein